MIHVFIGTKAQYVKLSPLLRLMQASGVPHRLIDSGQHAGLSAVMRAELGVPEPDVRLGGDRDVDSVPQALRWTAGVARRLVSAARLRREVFAGLGGVCVVHGDTPTTLLSALMAKRAGLAVAHVEAGLRTGSWVHPFPEEIIRTTVGRLADVLFAPDSAAAANLARTGVKGRVVVSSGNTVLESVRAAATAAGGDLAGGAGSGAGPAVVTMHRVENLHRRSRLRGLADLAAGLAGSGPVRWVMHGPTERALAGNQRDRLAAAGVELVSLAPHDRFLAMLAAAPFVITDGGSIQEECALLGTPTLLWRDRTDRPDGLGRNVVLSRYDPAVVEEFLADPERHRRLPQIPEVSPSAEILDGLAPWR